jgi:hypothetical protein
MTAKMTGTVSKPKLFEELEQANVFEEWKDMPEFVQGKQEPYQQIIVRFRCKEDVEEFSQLIGQPLTPKTKSIWHPRLVRGVNANKVWVDEP